MPPAHAPPLPNLPPPTWFWSTATDRSPTVTLNRPQRLNALDHTMWPALADVFSTLGADEGVRVVVLRGAGKAFSPGADISEFEDRRGSPDQAAAYGRVMDRAYAAITGCPHPVIARVAGPCTGAGMVLALLCDLRIAGESARMGAPVSPPRPRHALSGVRRPLRRRRPCRRRWSWCWRRG